MSPAQRLTGAACGPPGVSVSVYSRAEHVPTYRRSLERVERLELRTHIVRLRLEVADDLLGLRHDVLVLHVLVRSVTTAPRAQPTFSTFL